jgi:hypothetical protein
MQHTPSIYLPSLNLATTDRMRLTCAQGYGTARPDASLMLLLAQQQHSRRLCCAARDSNPAYDLLLHLMPLWLARACTGAARRPLIDAAA